MLESNYTLTTLKSEILNANGAAFSSYTHSISGYRYSIKAMDNGASENGVKFSKINIPGNYMWRLTATDSAGRTLVMDMPFTAVSSGSTATSTMGKIYDPTVSVTGVTVDLDSVALWEGEETTLTSTVSPSNATNQAVSWSSSDSNIATVTPVSGNARQGKVEAKKAGTATITCTTADGGKKATCIVTVKKHAISITVTPTTLELKPGGTSALTATINPSDASNKTVHWDTSNSAVATVNNGVVTARSAGKATITAMAEDGGYTATCEVTVVIPVSTITLNKSSLSLVKGDTSALTATVSPSGATNKNVVWTSNNTSVATVSASGVVTAVGGGTATITCTAADGYGAKATCPVTVSVPVTKVTVNPKPLTIRKGESARLTVTVEPGDATNKNVNWTSSDSNVATVSGGTVTAKGAGTATITCTAADGSGKSDTCQVTVIVPVESVTLNESTLIMHVGDVASLAATVLPADATNKTVNWTSNDSSVATVSNGVVTVVNPGIAVVTCKSTDGTNKSGICNVIVEESDYLLLSEKECTVEQGQTQDIYAELHLQDGSFATLVWTCDDGVTLNYIGGRQSGHVTVQSLTVGTYAVTCSTSDGSLSATCMLTIVPAPITDIELNSGELALDVGQSAQLLAQITPDYAAVSGVEWESSDAGVATVSSDGLVTAGYAGTAVITCYSAQNPNVSGSCTVVVSNPVTSVLLDPIRLEYDEVNGQSATLTAEVEPFDATDKTLSWSSSNPSVATVSGGEVQIVSYGYTRISCTAASGVTATCDVIVHADNVMNLPAALTQIDEEAFAETPIQEVILPDGVTVIGSGAFADCDGLRLIYIPKSVRSIAANAFSGSNVAFICDTACTATEFAQAHGIDYVIGSMPQRVIIVLDSGETVKNVPMTLRAIVLPENTIHRVKWSIVEGSNIASIVNGNQLLATSAGQVTVMATAVNGVSSTQAVSILDRYPTYTINLNANGGTCDPDSVVATLGKPIGTLPTPTRAGWRFTGWYTGAVGGIYVTGNSVFSDDEMETLELFAHWARIPVSITFDANGGICEEEVRAKNSGEAVGTLPEATRTDYTLDGWFTEDGTEVTAETTFEASVTLYAHWTRNICTITYDANGGSCATTSETINCGGAIPSLPAATRTYYTLEGWYTAASGGAKVTGSTTFTKDTTLYARWTRNTITINFNANYSGGSVIPNSKTINQGDAIGTLPAPTRQYYTLEGWYTSSGTKVTASTVFTANTTLDAHWTRNTITITFNANGGSVSKTTMTMNQGASIGTLPTPTRTYWNFGGWYTAATGGTKVETTTVFTANTTLYAQWPSQKGFGAWSDWSTTAVTANDNREVQTEVRQVQTGTKTIYHYERYLYWYTEKGYYQASYGSNWATSNGYSGSWQYATSETAWPVDHTTDGRNVYSGETRDGNRFWYNESVTTEPTYSSVTYYRYRDRIQ